MKVFVVIVLILLINSGESYYCYWNTGCPYKFFSSKTPYDFVRGDIRDSIVNLKDCEPVSIWSLIRHGKRNPSAKYAKNMKDAIAIRNYVISSYDKKHSSLCAQDVENLKNWNIDKKLFEQYSKLVDEGHEEMFGIGKRIKEVFPQLVSDTKDDSYTIRPAYGHWIEDSAKSFLKGLGNKNIKLQSYKKKDIIAPYFTCGKYQETIKKPDTYFEVDKYPDTSEYLATKDRIQRRSGIDYALSDVNITALYDLCRYTSSGFSGKVSPWCALFTTDDLQVLEYKQDLRIYFKNGYGTPENEKFGGLVLEDLLNNFRRVKTGHGKKLTAYFTHATMLEMVYISLGIFKDPQLTAANRVRDRKWRTSKMGAFGVNLIAILNKCSKHDTNDYNVVFYLNEEPMRSICEEGVCSWQEFEDKLKPFVNTTIDFCEFESEPYK